MPKAFETHEVLKDTCKYTAWQIAPIYLGPDNHYPFFNNNGHYWKDIDNPSCSKYENPSQYKLGYFSLAIQLHGSKKLMNL